MTVTATRSRAGVLTGVLTAALVCTGLMAGIFFAFTVSVMPGLHETDDRTFVTAMRGINAAIENGLFGLVFVGALGFTGLAAVLLARSGRRAAAWWAGAAAVLYLLVLILTMGVEVPLNDQLARAGDDFARARHDFEGVWVPVNDLRTVLTALALACLGPALAKRTAGVSR
ncbi:putative membrane protein [Actinoplanes octamycinicus]|uniref:Putative membrane protein n=1 Tax=Actinoplanes octamycinicus TaxID=135948 RepID=A0A7W7H511_9ACTN|nr:anthrone oxygenase family protein [Actinoplanes octamycinicus]MBB4744155.1 putative membrane protein [Actinoplanes octamycinicus]GIE56889.1 membrane protein [Actinoplanes octamycinicus]